MLGSALPVEFRELPRGPEHRDDFDGIALEAIDNPEGAYDQLADLGLLALGDDAPRLRELEQPLGRADEALHDKVRIERGVLGDVLVDRLEIPDGPR